MRVVRNGLQQPDRYRGARPAVLADLIESGVHDAGEEKGSHDEDAKPSGRRYDSVGQAEGEICHHRRNEPQTAAQCLPYGNDFCLH